MIIVNKVTDIDYIQWIEKFVKDVLGKNFDDKTIEIVDIEPSRRIFLIIDDEEYCIRTWNFNVVDLDDNDIPCAERVEWTLFKYVKDKSGSHGEELDDGNTVIEWKNRT